MAGRCIDIRISVGASTPEVHVRQLVDRLAALGYPKVEEQQVVAEDVFSMPRRLADPAGSRLAAHRAAEEMP